jgi:NTP pyrophosphatase (non-canonical NTP hydrolase)
MPLIDDLNQRVRGRVWTREETALGFVGDVGDLAELVMAAEGARSDVGGREALEHELADCLWSVLVLAASYDVDLGSAFDSTMDDLAGDAPSRQAQRGCGLTGRPGTRRHEWLRWRSG